MSYSDIIHTVVSLRTVCSLPPPPLSFSLCIGVSGIGRNGTFTGNLRLRFFVAPPPPRKIHFRGHSRTTNENFRSKFAREPTYFQEFLDPTKKGKRNLHNFHTGPSPTAVLGSALQLQYILYTRFAHRQLQQLSKLGVTTHYSKLYQLPVFDYFFWRDLSC